MEKKEEKRLLTAFAGQSIREIVNYANQESVQREDIVSLIKESGQYILVYYR